jgi:hypothetical protein
MSYISLCTRAHRISHVQISPTSYVLSILSSPLFQLNPNTQYSTEGKIKEPNLAAEAGQGLLSAATSYAKGDMGGVFKSMSGLIKTASGNTQKANDYARATRTSPADVVSGFFGSIRWRLSVNWCFGRSRGVDVRIRRRVRIRRKRELRRVL